MTSLLCRLGLHHAAWIPHFRDGRDFAPKIRTCRRCRKPLPRGHR